MDPSSPPPLPPMAPPVALPYPPGMPFPPGWAPAPIAPPGPPPRSYKTVLWTAIPIAFLAAIVVWTLTGQQDHDIAAVPPEPLVQKYREVAAAFRGEAVPPSDYDSQAIVGVMGRIGAEAVLPGGGSVLSHFDADATFDELERRGFVSGISRPERREMRRGFKEGYARGIPNGVVDLPWRRLQVRQVRMLRNGGSRGDGAEALAFVQTRFQNDLSCKMRWWFRKTPGGWKAYDYEDLDTGIRISTSMGMILSNAAQSPAVRGYNESAGAAFTALGNEDGKAAEAAAARIPASGLPPAMDATRWVLHGDACVLQDRHEESLGHYAKAESIHPDVPMVHLGRAAALNGLGRHGEALDSLDRYERVLGGDPVLSKRRGDALLAMGRRSEAASAYRGGLDDAPEYWQNLAALAAALPPGNKQELGQRLARVSRHRLVFRNVAAEVTGRKDADALAALVPAYRQAGAGGLDPYTDYYQGAEMMLRKRYAEAAEVFSAVRGRMPEEDQPLMDRELRTALMEVGRYADAYRAASSPK